MHSVALPDVVPELSEMGIIRGSLSFCFLLRQNGPGRVELYCRGFTDPRGEMMERVSVAIAAESLICVAGVVDYAYIKKLTWFMQHREHESLVSQRESHRQQRGARAGDSRCEACGKNFTRFGLLAVATGTATTGTGAACQICRRVVCAKCSVLKKMTVDVSDAGAVTQRALRFCLGCLLEVKEFSAWDMAISSVPTSPVSPSSSSSASGSIPSTPPPPPVPSVSRKLIHTRGPRSYSEYQRASTRVPRRGEMVADFTQTEDPPASAIIQQSKSRSNRQQAAPGTHNTSRPVKSHRTRIHL
ncbi:hypothetical protein BBJ28_00025884 [Nothophytophthora sp. Chile5]|nr:hypothetical protein BBJ28_00025884 [Nothophytophthora sp. Chile5]